ncbi:SH3 domain-containing protein [Mucilaginibacter conchicola]|uniref:SH3 domain-containing protein n=1 Tax=Mucilaginibacter conchicola TaxID=2303333 RepID=A0A372NR36_9SPHI|nr:SH3 domain-containing protein [Mucilaginibacter conchicola]RFZ90825.1 SH3 domain-containing protein [Mucilaginibacter conchicola]
MKINLFLLSLIFVWAKVNAQDYAIISAKDGYVNLREEPTTNAPIVTKLNNGEFVFFDPEEGKPNWISAYTKDHLRGFINQSGIKLVDHLPAVKRKHFFKNGCIIYNDSIRVTIISKAFDPKKHNLTYYKDEKGKIVYHTGDKIDGHGIWGTDGDTPKMEFVSIDVTIAGKHISIPKNALKDLYEPNYEFTRVYKAGQGVIYIKMTNGDGAGGYTVIFTIKNGKYINRYTDNTAA